MMELQEIRYLVCASVCVHDCHTLNCYRHETSSTQKKNGMLYEQLLFMNQGRGTYYVQDEEDPKEPFLSVSLLQILNDLI